MTHVCVRQDMGDVHVHGMELDMRGGRVRADMARRLKGAVAVYRLHDRARYGRGGSPEPESGDRN